MHEAVHHRGQTPAKGERRRTADCRDKGLQLPELHLHHALLAIQRYEGLFQTGVVNQQFGQDRPPVQFTNFEIFVLCQSGVLVVRQRGEECDDLRIALQSGATGGVGDVGPQRLYEQALLKKGSTSRYGGEITARRKFPSISSLRSRSRYP